MWSLRNLTYENRKLVIIDPTFPMAGHVLVGDEDSKAVSYREPLCQPETLDRRVSPGLGAHRGVEVAVTAFSGCNQKR